MADLHIKTHPSSQVCPLFALHLQMEAGVLLTSILQCKISAETHPRVSHPQSQRVMYFIRCWCGDNTTCVKVILNYLSILTMQQRKPETPVDTSNQQSWLRTPQRPRRSSSTSGSTGKNRHLSSTFHHQEHPDAPQLHSDSDWKRFICCPLVDATGPLGHFFLVNKHMR